MGEERGAEEATSWLAAWVGEHAPGVPVAPASLPSADEGEGVRLRLVGVRPRPEPRSPDRLRLKLALDYLLTVRLADPLAQQRTLLDLAFAAMEEPGVELVADGAAATCRSLGLPPAPGLLLRTEAVRTRMLPQAPLVREPAIIRLSPRDGAVATPAMEN